MNRQPEPSTPWPEHRARWGPACGVIFVVLLVVGLLVSNTPNTNKSPAYILAWYNKSSHKTSLAISTILIDIAVVFGMFWFGYLRDRWGRTDLGARLAPVLLAGGIVFAGGGLVFSGANAALLDHPKSMLPATAQTLNFLQSDIGFAGVTIGTSIILLAAGFIILRTRVATRVVGLGGLRDRGGGAGRSNRLLCVRRLWPLVSGRGLPHVPP